MTEGQQNWRVVAILVIALGFAAFLGCLGGGGGGGGSGTDSGQIEGVVLAGRVYFADRLKYGGIPIFAKDASGRIVASTKTDGNGNFAFPTLAPGIYDLVATTGEAEITFATSQQITNGSTKVIPDTPLLCLSKLIMDKIGSTTVRLTFSSNQKCKSSITYGLSIETPNTIQVSLNNSTDHEKEISGLTELGRYAFSITLIGEDGQKFKYEGLSLNTSGGAGPSNIGVVLNDGDYETRELKVRATLYAEGATEMRYGTSENLSDAAWVPFSTTQDIVLSDVPGTKRVYFQFRDIAGNFSPVENDSILFSPGNEGYVGIWIEKGAAVTNKTDVNLTLLFPGATRMIVSATSDFLNSFWENFAETRKWSLVSGDGEKTVYVKFEGGTADSTKVFTTSIILDTTGPEVAFKINGGTGKTNKLNVTLNFTNKGDAQKMQVRNDSSFSATETWKVFVSSMPWVISEGDGQKTVYARFQDEVGNVVGPVTAQITLDTVPPSAPSFTINDGASSTTSVNVRLKLSATGASRMIISNAENFVGAVDEIYKANKNWTLGGYGLQDIFVKFLDDATNSTDIVIQSILVVGVAPSSTSIVINSGDASTENINASLKLTAPNAINMRLSQNGNFNSLADVPFANSIAFTLSRVATLQTVFGRFENASGDFSFASDSILVVGPASPTLTTDEIQPVPTYTVRLKPFAVGATNMLINEDYNSLSNEALIEAYSNQKIFVLQPFGGFHTVWAKFRNAGGVETTPISLNINASGTSVGNTIIVNAGDSSTNRSNVQLSVNAPGMSIMWVSQDGNFNSVAPEVPPTPPQTRAAFLTSPRAGVKTFYARFQNGTGPYFYASDTIDAVGPASSSLTTPDKQPINSNWLNLVPYAVGATHMIVSENIVDMDSSTLWIPYQSPITKTLNPGGGNHTIYAKFKNNDTNYIETVPVQLIVQLLSTPPSNNTASIRETAAPASPLVASAAVGSLPVYLHFTISDQNTKTVYYAIASSGAQMPATFTAQVVPVAPVPLYDTNFPGNGVFNIWYKFADGAGNMTAVSVVSIDILGPSITISPATVGPLFSGQIQQFSATLKYTTGTVNWSLIPLIGAIDSTGRYTAPNPITASAQTKVHAELNGNPSVFKEVTINLQTQVEVIPGLYSSQISVNSVVTIPITFKNSTLGGYTVISPSVGGGVATVSTAVVGPSPSDMVATVTYTAPAAVPVPSSVVVTVYSSQDPSKTKDLNFNINAGPWISVNPNSGTVRRRTGSLTIAANTSSDPAGTIEWTTPYGSFDSFGSGITNKITNYPHSVKFFSSNAVPALNPVDIQASFTPAGVIISTCSIVITSPVGVTISPKTDSVAVATSTGITFQAQVDNATSTAVTWEYRNASQAAWTLAGVPIAPDCGNLTNSGNNVIYNPPATFPTPLGNWIEVRATSKDDTVASDVATITLVAPINVIIHQGFDALAPIATQSTATLEVGTIQFFAEIQNAKPGANLTVVWYVENVQGGNSTYGTVDSTGKYISPTTLPQSVVTIKAVSNADPSRFGTCKINLQNFWTPRSEGLRNITNATDPVYSVMVDPTTGVASANQMFYAGTNGFGVYVATITNLPTVDWDQATWWGGYSGLFTNLTGQGSQYVINRLTQSKANSQRIVAATGNGIYLANGVGGPMAPITVPGVRPNGGMNYDTVFTTAFSSAIIAPDDTYLYVIGENQGVLRYIWNGGSNQYDYDGTLYDDKQRYSTVFYVPGSVTYGSSTYNYEEPFESKVIPSGTMRFTFATTDPNNADILYVGFTDFSGNTPSNGYVRFNTAKNSEYLWQHNVSIAYRGTAPPGSSPKTLINYWDIGAGGYSRTFSTGVPMSMAVDPNTPTTLWEGKDVGIFRTTNNGTSWSQVQNYVNVRDIFIDPVNTITVYVGTENGVYRSPDAGANWKQIKSGLEGHTTINSLGLSPGGIGKRRLVVGTTDGIYIGYRSLDLE